MNHHILSIDETFSLFNTGTNGISSVAAEELLKQYGPNSLVEHKRKSAFQILLHQFADFMIIVLIAAAIIAGFIGDLTDTVIILVIVLLNAVIGFVQEYRADKAMEALKKMVPANCIVIRNGHSHQIASEQLVPGDMVVLEAGGIVPADIRLTESFSMKTVESSLTGESHSIDKITAQLHEEMIPIGDRRNMAYKGTSVTYGRGKGIVVATGMETELGKITSMLQEEDVKTPLQKRLNDFGKKLSFVILFICVVIFTIGFIRGEEPLLMFLTAVSLAVAAIPEALPAVITIALANGARRMVKQNALIRNLPAVETLGSVTYICTDKTGTLTENKMTVDVIYDGTHSVNVKELPKAGHNEIVKQLLTAMALCNDVSISEDHQIIGDPTEYALYKIADDFGYKKNDLERNYPRVGEIPFDSHRKCMTTIHR